MKTLPILFAAWLCTAMLASCHSDDLIQENSSALRITPTLEQTSTRSESDGFNPKKQWTKGDEMGLFVYDEAGFGQPYLHFVSQNMRSVYLGDRNWQMDKPVYLNSQQAVVWSYYPYSAEVYDGTAIPVPIHPENPVDYMYGKSINKVSALETDAKIPMNHALSQFVLRLKISPNYAKDGKLTSIKLKTDKPKFSQRGTMDLSQDGKISFEPTLTQLNWEPTEHQKTDLDYSALVYPMTLTNNEVTLEIVLDGEKWSFTLPEAEWKAGKRHIYTVTAKFKDVELGGEGNNGVSVQPWIDTNIDMEIEGK